MENVEKDRDGSGSSCSLKNIFSQVCRSELVRDQLSIFIAAACGMTSRSTICCSLGAASNDACPHHRGVKQEAGVIPASDLRALCLGTQKSAAGLTNLEKGTSLFISKFIVSIHHTISDSVGSILFGGALEDFQVDIMIGGEDQKQHGTDQSSIFRPSLFAFGRRPSLPC